jgi:hypothetical protein
MKAGTARVGGQNLVDHIATWARISEMARESFPDDSNATVIAIKRRSRPRKLLSIFLVCAFPVTNADQQPDIRTKKEHIKHKMIEYKFIRVNQIRPVFF